jgi:hypothetical protein
MERHQRGNRSMIRIEVLADYGPNRPALDHQVDEALAAIGFHRGDRPVPVRDTSPGPSALPPAAEPASAQTATEPTAAPEPAAATAASSSEPPKRTRRTKAQIEADRAAAAGETPQISTGEERVDPAVSAEDAAQDEADEAAEVEENRDTAKPLTHDDVRGALGVYVRRYGLPAAQEDGPKLLKLLFPEGDVVKTSDIPVDQDTLRRVIAGVDEMITKNPYKRAAVAPGA